MKDKTAFTIGIVVCTTIGAALLMAGYLFLSNTLSFVDSAVKTKGVIIDLNEYEDSEGDTMYAPIFKFKDLKNKEYTIESNYSSNSGFGGIGSEISILYLQKDPKSARIDSFVGLYLLPIILGGMGVVTLFIGISSAIFFIIFNRLENKKKLSNYGKPPDKKDITRI